MCVCVRFLVLLHCFLKSVYLSDESMAVKCYQHRNSV